MSFFSSPTVLDGCTDAALSSDFCFLVSLSLSLRRWQRWWWWWWWARSWPWICPDPIEDWAKPGRSRSYSLSPTSWRCCCVSEDAERLMGLRSTIGWEGKRSVGKCEEKEGQRGGCGSFTQTTCTGSPKYLQHTKDTTSGRQPFVLRSTFNPFFSRHRRVWEEWTQMCDRAWILTVPKLKECVS